MISKKWVFTFGKHIGKSIAEVPPDYLLYLYYGRHTFGSLRQYITAHLEEIRARTSTYHLLKFEEQNTKPVDADTVFHFGKWKGYKIKDVPPNYLVEAHDEETIYGPIMDFIRENIDLLRRNQDPHYDPNRGPKPRRPPSKLFKEGVCKKCNDGKEKELSYNHKALCNVHARQYDIIEDMKQNKRRFDKQMEKKLELAKVELKQNPIPEPEKSPQNTFFKRLWDNEKYHQSHISNKYFFFFDVRLFTYVLPIKQYPEFEFYYKNVVLLTPEQKNLWLQKDHSEIEKKQIWQKMYVRVATLKKEHILLKAKAKGKSNLELKSIVDDLVRVENF